MGDFSRVSVPLMMMMMMMMMRGFLERVINSPVGWVTERASALQKTASYPQKFSRGTSGG